VGTKAVNALSSAFSVQAFRDGQTKSAQFERGILTEETGIVESSARKGTKVVFVPDPSIFVNYRFQMEYVERLVWNYVYLNPGLTITLNGEKFYSENGLKDLLANNLSGEVMHEIIHLRGEDIEVALTHAERSQSEQYYSFVNGQHTTQGGTHQSAFREALVATVRQHFGKQYEAADIRQSVIGAISIKVIEPVFESQTKTKLGSNDMGPEGPTVRTFIANFLQTELDNFLHRNPAVAEAIQRKILRAERERKELSGIQKLARERAKKANLHNRKLRDCKVHYNDIKHERRLETTLFITEGDSASGSITASRDVQTQAVFSLKGKPLNCYGLTKKVVYENEEFNLLQAALNIEDGLEELRYNNVVVATDADVDGMHIRLLLITFFLQFFPELVREGHLYILQTPLFRVRNKQKTIYCYDESEKQAAMAELGVRPEITRFKGLGEISPGEFKMFIGENIRLEPVMLGKEQIDALLEYYMGKNTPERQEFIIDHLKVEKDLVDHG
jgi:topoisomerase IV subunit B